MKRVVVDNQGAKSLEIYRMIFFSRMCKCRLKWNFHAEHTAFSKVAAHCDLSVHHLHQSHANGETKSRALPLQCGVGLQLRKTIENDRLFFGRNSDASVCHV